MVSNCALWSGFGNPDRAGWSWVSLRSTQPTGLIYRLYIGLMVYSVNLNYHLVWVFRTVEIAITEERKRIFEKYGDSIFDFVIEVWMR